jgi:hypothetical protein
MQMVRESKPESGPGGSTAAGDTRAFPNAPVRLPEHVQRLREESRALKRKQLEKLGKAEPRRRDQ